VSLDEPVLRVATPEDAARLRIADGDRVRLTAAAGRFEGRARIDAIKPGNVEVHWPEGNGLLSREQIDAASLEPDYNAVADLERLGP